MTTTRRGRHVCDVYLATGWLHRLDSSDGLWVWSPSRGLLCFCSWGCLVGYATNLPFAEPSVTLSALRTAVATGTAG